MIGVVSVKHIDNHYYICYDEYLDHAYESTLVKINGIEFNVSNCKLNSIITLTEHKEEHRYIINQSINISDELTLVEQALVDVLKANKAFKMFGFLILFFDDSIKVFNNVRDIYEPKAYEFKNIIPTNLEFIESNRFYINGRYEFNRNMMLCIDDYVPKGATEAFVEFRDDSATLCPYPMNREEKYSMYSVDRLLFTFEHEDVD